jgi:hypothetical protein
MATTQEKQFQKIRANIQHRGIIETDLDTWGDLMQQRIARGGLAALLSQTPEKPISEEFGEEK